MLKLKKFFIILLLAISSHAATLTCSFSLAPNYQCNSFNLSPVTQINEAITISTPPTTPYIDNTTTHLNLPPHFTIQQFPRKVFEIFTAVRFFNAENISTSELGTDSFYNCKNLNYIYFSSSNLGNIRGGFARTCHFVNSFSASDCKILSVDENAFQGMLSLQGITMRNCGITCLPPKVFQPLKGLTSIDLTRNKINAVHSQLFADLMILNMINLSDNLIGYIPNLNLHKTGTTSLLSILMANNPIKAIHPLLLTTLNYGRVTGSSYSTFISFNPNDPQNFNTCVDPNLSQSLNSPVDFFKIGSGSYSGFYLIFQNTTYQYSTTCYTSFTPAMASDSLVTCGSILTTTLTTTLRPGGTTSLKNCATDKICRYYLDWNNQYTCVIDGAEGTVTSISGTHFLSYADVNVTRIYFTKTFLIKIPKVIFTKFKNLKYLSIRNSGLSVINDQTFSECGNLEFLDASDNEIFRVEETALKNCTKLKVIDLTGNPIEVIGNGFFPPGPSLKKIYLNRSNDWILA